MTLALQLAQASVETRSRSWVWVVAVGLVLVAALVAVIARAVLKSLPDDVGAPVRTAARTNAVPLGVGAVIVIGTIVFALWSAGMPVIEDSGTSADVAAGRVSASGDEASTDSTTLDGTPVGSPGTELEFAL